MTMWNKIRQSARERHASLRELSGEDISAAALLSAADEATGFSREPVAPGDTLLDGGQAQLDTEAEVIWFNHELDPGIASYYQAHEYAHLWLHGRHICF